MTIENIISIVKEAAKFMVDDCFEVTQKDGFANIVTSSDLAVQEFLCEHLSALLPGSGFICEEDDVINASQEYTWIIDPIDGTANYARGVKQCAISVALKQHDDIVMGVVYVPRDNELYYAEKGRGAYLNGKQIHVSQRQFADAVLCTALPVYYKEHAPECADIILRAFQQCNDVRRFGAAAPELCYLALGRFELYFEYTLSPWDFAAATLVLTEAGGVLTDRNGNKPTFTEKTGVVAANTAENHARLLALVNHADA